MSKGFSRITQSLGATVAALVLTAGFNTSVRAQGLPGEGDIRTSQPATINAVRDVAWDQKLDNQVTLGTTFRDENDREVPLGTYFGHRPVILVMPFYKCPGMCTIELSGMVDVFRDEKFRYKVGRDFDVVTLSINPNEKGDLATAKKKEYLDILAQPGAETGWHFLTGSEASIRKLADETGFRYKYQREDQYAHPSGIVFLTPKGRVSRYLFGAVYSPKDTRLAITEAGQGRIGSIEDKFVLACYHYDPKTGKYGLAVFRVLQVCGFATVFALGSFMILMFRKDARDGRAAKAGIPAPDDDKAEKA